MIGIICFVSMRYAQFALKYTNILDNRKIEYEFISWNRDELPKPKQENWIYYNYPMNSFQPIIYKIKGFYSYISFIRKKIKEKKYDKLIILATQTAIPLTDILLYRYKGKYIYDYRDVTYENIGLYRQVVNCLVKYSSFTGISSKGFYTNLKPSEKFVIAHNTRNFELELVEYKKSNKIRLSFWGMIRQLDYTSMICDMFSNDERFELFYHGGGYYKELKKYCEKKGYSNIFVTGPYNLTEIKSFANNTDVLINCYENDIHQKPAMTVKFYDSIRFGIPMIVSEGSYMSEIVNKKCLGFIVDFNNFNLDKLYDEICSFDYQKYIVNNEEIFIQIKEDDKIFEQKVIEFCDEV